MDRTNNSYDHSIQYVFSLSNFGATCMPVWFTSHMLARDSKLKQDGHMALKRSPDFTLKLIHCIKVSVESWPFIW